MANVDAADGDTLYQLNAAQAPFVLQLGNHADGRGVWVANLDPSAVITVEWSGAEVGMGKVNLSGQGDTIRLPAGDITLLAVTSNVYPAFIGWAYLPAHAELDSAMQAVGDGPGTSGVTELTASATGAATALAPALAAAAGHTTYCTGFEVTGTGATGTSTIAVTLTGIAGGTATYYMVIPAGAALAVTPLQVSFARPVAASAVNTAITLNVPSFGAGNLNAAAVLHGYRA